MVSFHWRDYTHRHICPHWEFMQLQQGWDAFIHYAWWKVGARSLLAPLVCFAVNDVQYENYGIWTIWAVQLLQNYCLEAWRTLEWNWITTSVPRAHHTCVAAGWVPGHWIHNAPIGGRFCVGIILKEGQRLPTISTLRNMIAKEFTLRPRVEAQEIVTATTRAVELAELYQLLKTSWKLA